MKRILIVHPLLFAVYPVLALLAHNISQVPLTEAVRSLIIVVLGSGILLLWLRYALKNWYKAGLITSALVLWFFSYAHIYNLLKASDLNLISAIGRHRYLLPISVTFLAGVSWWVIRQWTGQTQLTNFLNLVAALSLVLPLYTIAAFELRTAGRAQSDFIESEALQFPDDERPPDIFYIIMDAYAREDTLRKVFNYDNTPFLQDLAERGFYVVHHSRSNYGYTSLSLASSLNMDYLQNLIVDLDPYSRQQEPLWELIRQSRVRIALEGLGYKMVAFSTGYSGTEIKDADVYITGGALDQVLGLNAFSNFEGMLIDNSAGVILLDGAIALPLLIPDLKYPYQLHREWVLNVFDHLSEMPQTDDPMFVFAHIISPHSPFVFERDGSPVKRPPGFTLGFAFADGASLMDEEYIEAYRNQLHYINTKLLQTIDSILAHSETPPIIILQSDHGPVPKGSEMRYTQQRMAILSAYYLPENDDELLYPTITPVNTFRVVFNTYFGGTYELLPDHVYFSTYPMIFDFSDVADDIDTE